MENRNERKGPMAVPQFGGWDLKGPGGGTDYSMVFSRARADRKKQKADIKRISIGNEKEVLAATDDQQQEDSVMRKKKILTYINCCIRV